MKKALVVDDNASNLMLEKDLLDVAGFEVFGAENAAGGIAIALKEKPDIIIMDVRLPDMRGTEAARILRREKETSDVPIVFVTASVMAGGIEEIKNITNSGFIGKPINTRTFAKEISQSGPQLGPGDLRRRGRNFTSLALYRGPDCWRCDCRHYLEVLFRRESSRTGQIGNKAFWQVFIPKHILSIMRPIKDEPVCNRPLFCL